MVWRTSSKSVDIFARPMRQLAQIVPLSALSGDFVWALIRDVHTALHEYPDHRSVALIKLESAVSPNGVGQFAMVLGLIRLIVTELAHDVDRILERFCGRLWIANWQAISQGTVRLVKVVSAFAREFPRQHFEDSHGILEQLSRFFLAPAGRREYNSKVILCPRFQVLYVTRAGRKFAKMAHRSAKCLRRFLESMFLAESQPETEFHVSPKKVVRGVCRDFPFPIDRLAIPFLGCGQTVG
jgi:hypothetical protein